MDKIIKDMPIEEEILEEHGTVGETVPTEEVIFPEIPGFVPAEEIPEFVFTEEIPEFYSKHYITIDEQNRIVNGFSDAFGSPTEADICINEQGGYQFRLFPDGEENPCLFNFEYMIPLYKYENEEVMLRTEEEIEADIAAIPEPEAVPTQLDIVEAQALYTAMMTDTLLEEV